METIVANITIDQEQLAKALRRFGVARICAAFTVAFALALVVLQMWPSINLEIKKFRQCGWQCQLEAGAILKQISECEVLLKSGAIQEALTKCADVKARADALKTRHGQP
jgi:hypothetical protein